ncbi:hypothetical protein CC1G_12783 [Coprinopsis cinerea okayama7|uniref:CxC1-like cysteine cluster associated with KDZ transposases domain-containing protein n=1 Tax=Coprinopsis cinerea (strain Okayama-7 / 130 / ATCC MYA-4618 / FGSC 9003) TaxID=240176 RepID=A8PHT9_COPC7|nr:hypothetical protein CC1G_12783 [Coprinopsis cinerea okayama7\|eukprot:XP_001841463.2 hypothetical protein CC1G_12783 [Coprinopsis cinerea okayama7\
MLDFIHELYARSALNLSAWSGSLEACLARQGYPIKGQDVLRRKMASTVKWYNYMVAQKEAVIDSVVWNASRDSLQVFNGESAWREGEDVCGEDLAFDAIEDQDNDWEDVGLDEPSRYLQDRCPLCFSSRRGTRECQSEVILCLDANFTQKRRNPARGEDRSPPLIHPFSVFLLQEEVSKAKAYVEGLRPSESRGATGPARTKPNTGAEEDSVDSGMRVPNSVLDGCLESFTAADEKRTKASTRLFADTGLMALLCRHDRPLWLVNMMSAGERQYYAIALLLKFFSHVPDDMTLGLLYDVACQLHRSCMKWGFLKEYHPRIRWSVSVFHAYGHQWACQLIYHPRKCDGFGLSDGEGCERFWAAIKILIPALRVSGYHQRLFAIDGLVAYLNAKSLRSLGRWLGRKWDHCQKKKAEGATLINKSGCPREVLSKYWEEQVESQTKPLAKASEHAAKRAVKEILALVKHRDGLKVQMAKITRQIRRNDTTVEMDMEDLVTLSLSLTTKINELNETIANRRRALGASAKDSLDRLSKSDFVKNRLNAAALKSRICNKLRGRKFELERLDRASRNPSSTDNKLQAQIQAQVSRHEPNILKLVKRYNDTVGVMESLIQQRKAPRNAIVPKRIPKERLFTLDVDDPIWDMRGLDDDDDGKAPPWLADDAVIHGIRGHLVVLRCEEEEERLVEERQHLQQWSRSVWKGLQTALALVSNDDLRWALVNRQNDLLSLIMEWSKDVVRIPGDDGDGWGPTERELRTHIYRVSQQEFAFNVGFDKVVTCQDNDHDDLALEDDEDEWYIEGDDELLEVVDGMYLGELYGQDTYDDMEDTL